MGTGTSTGKDHTDQERARVLKRRQQQEAKGMVVRRGRPNRVHSISSDSGDESGPRRKKQKNRAQGSEGRGTKRKRDRLEVGSQQAMRKGEEYGRRQRAKGKVSG